MIDSEKVPQLVELTAAISAILGPQWRLLIENWEEAAHISWHPDSAPGKYPVAVDFYSEASGEGPCKVQVDDSARAAVNPEITEKVNAVVEWARANNVLLGFEHNA
jgi:hypothetical protein